MTLKVIVATVTVLGVFMTKIKNKSVKLERQEATSAALCKEDNPRLTHSVLRWNGSLFIVTVMVL